MTPIDIKDPSDPRISAFRDIRERDLVGREGRFVAEGKVVLKVLFARCRFEPEAALILDKRFDGIAETLREAPPDMPVYRAEQAVMDEIAGFHIHRGILAIGRKRMDADASDLIGSLPQDALIAVLVGISNHDNVGAIFRNAAALGADCILLDATSCDPLYRKAIRVSVGATLSVPYAFVPSSDMAHMLLDQHGFEQIALTPRNADDLVDVSAKGRQALYLGAEGPGLPDRLMEKMRRVRIDIAADFDSLNVAAASAIALHRLSRLSARRSR